MTVETIAPPKSISDIYYLANTPMYLYTMMRQDPNVVLFSEKPTGDLINEFNKLGSSELTKQDEVAMLYAYLIAISLKPRDEASDFMKYVKEKVKYEWFPKIADIYLSSNASKLVLSTYSIPTTASTIIL